MIKSWISNKITNSELYGWVLDPEDIRKFINIKVTVGDIVYLVVANEKRSKPKSFPEHINNGFRISFKPDELLMIKEGDLISIIDAVSDDIYYKTRIAEIVIPGDLDTNSKIYVDNCKIIKESGLFSENWYISNYNLDKNISAMEHYMNVGWKCMYDPSPLFSTFGYFVLNRDVFKANANPLLHFLKQRRKNKIRSIATVADLSNEEFYDSFFSELNIINKSDLFDS